MVKEITYKKIKKCSICSESYGSDFRKDNGLCHRCGVHGIRKNSPKVRTEVGSLWS